MEILKTSFNHSPIFDEFSSCDNPTKWHAIVVRLAKRYGLSFATLMQLPKPSDRFFKPLTIVSNLPPKLLHYFDEYDLLHQSPLLNKLSYSIAPQVWTLQQVEKQKLLPDNLIEAFREFSIYGGVAFSFTAISGERFVLLFDGAKPDLQGEKLNELLMSSVIAFDVYQNMRRNSLSINRHLTKREIEVVRWTAQGKTSSEIAAILSLSDHTVNAYMNNAIKKLECVNRTQLVAKAIRLKLI